MRRSPGPYLTEPPCPGLARPGSLGGAGWVAERFKAAVLKTANPQGFVGSNPTPSANGWLTEDPARNVSAPTD